MVAPSLERYWLTLRELDLLRPRGRVAQVVGLGIEVEGLDARVGDACRIVVPGGVSPVPAEVVGFQADRTMLMPLGDLAGVGPGVEVQVTGHGFPLLVGDALLGRVLDPMGRPLDDLGPIRDTTASELHREPPHPLSRQPIETALATGVRAMDALLTCGKGQRLGIFAGSGVGKSTLLGMIARHACADVNVIALVGERGREVQEFLAHELGAEGLRRSVLVVSSSADPPLLRQRAAWVATAIAEHFRDAGKDVILMMDSLTRFAMASREVGLAAGEPPATKGYPPSVFAVLPRLLERAGAGANGTITAFYTVLVEGDDLNEPVSDTVRGILDGHVVLSRDIAARNHFPAIDLLGSLSRVMPRVVDANHLRAAGELRRLLAAYEGARDLINIGAYAGGDPLVDQVLRRMAEIDAFLRQAPDERTPFDATLQALTSLVAAE